LSRADILAQYTVVRKPEEFEPVYAPLITDLGADIVGIQATAVDQEALIRDIGERVVPGLKRLRPAKR
jgi:inhibitor of KinA sporulation pathway (predicted exonuclease)